VLKEDDSTAKNAAGESVGNNDDVYEPVDPTCKRTHAHVYQPL